MRCAERGEYMQLQSETLTIRVPGRGGGGVAVLHHDLASTHLLHLTNPLPDHLLATPFQVEHNCSQHLVTDGCEGYAVHQGVDDPDDAQQYKVSYSTKKSKLTGHFWLCLKRKIS